MTIDKIASSLALVQKDFDQLNIHYTQHENINSAGIIKLALTELDQIFQYPASNLLGKITLSELTHISTRIDEITQLYKEFIDKNSTGFKDDLSIGKGIELLPSKMKKLMGNFYQALHANEEKKRPTMFGRATKTVANSAIQTGCKTALLYQRKAMIDELDEEIKAQQRDLMAIPREFARLLSKYAVFMIKDQLEHITFRDPNVRAPFLKEVVDNIDVEAPNLNAIGIALSTLLNSSELENSSQELTGGEELLQKIIEANLLRAMKAIYTQLGAVQAEDEFCLVKFIQNCLAELNSEDAIADKKLRKEFISGSFAENMANSFLNTAFPNGKTDIFIPKSLMAWPQFIKNFIAGLLSPLQPEINEGKKTLGLDETIRNCIWPSVVLGCKKQILLGFRLFGFDSMLKQTLLTSFFESIDECLRKAPVIDEKNVGNAADVKVQKTETQKKSEDFVVPFGAVFLFFQLLFSLIGNAVLGLFKEEQKPVEHTYKDQPAFNNELEKLITCVEKESSSWLFRWIIRRKKAELIQMVGPQLMNDIQKINIKNLFTDQLKNLLLALFQGGKWEDDTFICTFTLSPMTEYDYKVEQEKKGKEKSLIEERLDKAQGGLGDSIDGLIDIVWNEFKMELPEKPLPEASHFTQVVYTVKKSVISFFNACIRKCIHFMLRISCTGEKLKEAAKIIRKKVDLVEQDTFLFSASNYLEENFMKNKKGSNRSASAPPSPSLSEKKISAEMADNSKPSDNILKQ
ncbi:MAG: hypothetical protein QRY74_02705 [Chlamydia sp.]